MQGNFQQFSLLNVRVNFPFISEFIQGILSEWWLRCIYLCLFRDQIDIVSEIFDVGELYVSCGFCRRREYHQYMYRQIRVISVLRQSMFEKNGQRF